jgi:hypothetical protein
MSQGRVHCGVHGPLEREADAIIYGSLKDVTSQEAKSDILTPWKEQDRRSREVYSNSGSVDPKIRRGMFYRVVNPTSPHLNSRDGVSPPIKDFRSPISYLSSPEGYYDSDDTR